MQINIDLSKHKNEDGTFNPEAVKAAELLTGQSINTLLNSNENEFDGISKKDLKDPAKRAEFFMTLRKQGKRPKEVFDSLPE